MRGLRDPALQGDLGATAVLHTHNRALDFHPHVPIVLPAGAIDSTHQEWRTAQSLLGAAAMERVI
jgi:Putative transposase